ncbi:MAG: insulinase family protein, partial [Acidobacteria bacterium]|nr:insulinase family protein [Acidobacteriota bacterium]
ELDRARTLQRAQRIGELQSSLRRAMLLAQYEMFDRNPEFIVTELDHFLSVTPPQIQAAVKKYFVPDHRVVLEIVPAPKKEEKK